MTSRCRCATASTCWLTCIGPTRRKFPVLIAASPYPRQIQNIGAPFGFIEAGASDFWVPRGYVHVIANCRGTSGSGGTFGFFDAQERRDMYDLVEWAAAQPWSDGNVGMLGISYFAMTQLEAAVEQPPHLKAIFPLETTIDLYESAVHHGLMSSSFVTTFLAMIGMTSGHTNKLWRSRLLDGIGELLRTPHIHGKFATANGEAAMAGLKALLKLHHDPHPWDDLWRAVAVEHPVRDEWWDDHNLVPLLDRIQVPAYVGCDWANGPLHLPGSLDLINALPNSPHVRVAMLGDLGISWPWETMHIEALAWFDHWLKGRDTGILDGPSVRYQLRKGEADGWKTADTWPVPGVAHHELALRTRRHAQHRRGRRPGSAPTWSSGPGSTAPGPARPTRPRTLAWETEPFTGDLDVLGNIELRLDATASAADTAWIITLQDVAPDDNAADVTAGYLRASLRAVDEAASEPGAPSLPCTSAEAVPINEAVSYRIPIVGTGYRFAAGHRLRLALTVTTRTQVPGRDDLPPRQRRHQQPQPHRLQFPAAPARHRRDAVIRSAPETETASTHLGLPDSPQGHPIQRRSACRSLARPRLGAPR